MNYILIFAISSFASPSSSFHISKQIEQQIHTRYWAMEVHSYKYFLKIAHRH